MGPLKVFSLAVSPTGSAGVAGGSARKGVLAGVIKAIAIAYTSQPGTVDVTITTTINGVPLTILTRTSTNANFPLQAVHVSGRDNLGAAVAADKNAELVLPVVAGEVVVTVAQGDAVTNGVVVTFAMET